MHNKKKKSISKNSTSILVLPSRNVSLTEQAALLSPASSLEIAQERSIFHIPSSLPPKLDSNGFVHHSLPPFHSTQPYLHFCPLFSWPRWMAYTAKRGVYHFSKYHTLYGKLPRRMALFQGLSSVHKWTKSVIF